MEQKQDKSRAFAFSERSIKVRSKILKNISVVVVLVALLLLVSLPAVEAKPPITTQDFVITDIYEGSLGPWMGETVTIPDGSGISGCYRVLVAITCTYGDLYWTRGSGTVTFANPNDFESGWRIIVSYWIRSDPHDPIYQ